MNIGTTPFIALAIVLMPAAAYAEDTSLDQLCEESFVQRLKEFADSGNDASKKYENLSAAVKTVRTRIWESLSDAEKKRINQDKNLATNDHMLSFATSEEMDDISKLGYKVDTETKANKKCAEYDKKHHGHDLLLVVEVKFDSRYPALYQEDVLKYLKASSEVWTCVKHGAQACTKAKLETAKQEAARAEYIAKRDRELAAQGAKAAEKAKGQAALDALNQ
jgi:hypothetical protein